MLIRNILYLVSSSIDIYWLHLFSLFHSLLFTLLCLFWLFILHSSVVFFVIVFLVAYLHVSIVVSYPLVVDVFMLLLVSLLLCFFVSIHCFNCSTLFVLAPFFLTIITRAVVCFLPIVGSFWFIFFLFQQVRTIVSISPKIC